MSWRLHCCDCVNAPTEPISASEIVIEKALRLWGAVSAFERHAAKICGDLPAPRVEWDGLNVAALKLFMLEHGAHIMEIVDDDGNAKPVTITFGSAWKQQGSES